MRLFRCSARADKGERQWDKPGESSHNAEYYHVSVSRFSRRQRPRCALNTFFIVQPLTHLRERAFLVWRTESCHLSQLDTRFAVPSTPRHDIASQLAGPYPREAKKDSFAS